ncbi:MAG TPA: VOC family protein [Pseudobdellovibrionaceae bacterium]|jgi:catechol 2,3-dioxygenase-like lactoylglutathione lyase family enzyme
MGIVFTSITVNTPNLENMIRFYEILGCEFSKVKVNIGGELFRSCFEGFELSLMSIKSAPREGMPKVMMGFQVSDFDSKVKLLALVPGVLLILDPTDMPDGRKAIVQDPDGHSIELLSKEMLL